MTMNSEPSLLQVSCVDKTFTVSAVSKAYYYQTTAKCQQFGTDCNEVFACLRERFLFRFREFLLMPNDWSFTFFFLHDSGFGPLMRFRLYTNSARIPKVDSFKQFNVVCSCTAGSILV